VIEIQQVSKRFDNIIALNGVSLTIPRGEVLGVLGPNGAGKTTLFKLVAGLLRPDSGEIQASNGRWPVIGYKPDRLLFPNQMRVGQYLETSAALSNIHPAEIRRVAGMVLERVGLTAAVHKRIKDCSKGMRQRLGLAQALIGDPPFLLLDEPSNGLDPEGQYDICRAIQELHASGKTIVISSHQLHEVTQVCTRLIILNQGRILYEKRMADALKERPHMTILVSHDLEPIAGMLVALHSDIQVLGREIILEREALPLRRAIMSIVLAAGFDIIRVEQQRVTLAEIYAEAVR
jgi:ABC-type multidrug transport system ATPase subunit